MKAKLIFTTLFGVFFLYETAAKSDTEKYIEEYKDAAIEEMKEYGIPASITLAQGILESGSGNSYLATEANNHFGIKCHRDWDGKRIYYSDDEENECFRVYDDAEESYRDHSLFLTERERYSELFKLSPTDYKAWAKGLKKAGYATNKHYADLLIDLIEKYELHKLDLEGFNEELDKEEKEIFDTYQVNLSTNMVKFIKVKEGDTFEKIAEATDKRVEDLLKHNELRYDDTLSVGQIIYLQPKRKRADRQFRVHKVEEGETMYSISQKFAIRLRHLYEMNDKKAGWQPAVGQVVRLR